jgi:hypothetical protein
MFGKPLRIEYETDNSYLKVYKSLKLMMALIVLMALLFAPDASQRLLLLGAEQALAIIQFL